MRTQLIEAGDRRWPAFLDENRHDFYHLPGYVELAAGHEAGDPAAVLVEDGRRALLQPVIVRAIRLGGHDATTPYGYPGPLVRSGTDPAFAETALAAVADHLRDRGLVSLFLRLHPLLNPEPPRGTGSVHREGETVSVDLTLPPDEQWRRTRANHRRHIHRARRAGRTARWDDDWTHGDEFEQLYRSTMQRVDATPWYFFDHDHFEGLRRALGERLRLVVVEASGSTAAAALFVETCGIVQYHLSATDPAFAREGLTKLMIDHVRRWATERRDEVLHLGGGVGGAQDPLLHFKTGFSTRRHAYHTVRVVLDPVAYGRLVERLPGPAAAPSGQDAGGYFPAYRRPVPASDGTAGSPADLGAPTMTAGSGEETSA